MELSKQEQFMFKEFEEASRITYHTDVMRNNLIGFFLSFIGVAVTILTILVKGEWIGSSTIQGTTRIEIKLVSIAVIILIVALGVIAVLITARLRRTQLEYFRIMNNIRRYFYGEDLTFWNTVELCAMTLPRPNRSSGSYYSLLSIIIVNSILLSFSIYTILSVINTADWLKWFIIFPMFIISLYTQDRLYLKLAEPPAIRIWSDVNPPNPKDNVNH